MKYEEAAAGTVAELITILSKFSYDTTVFFNDHFMTVEDDEIPLDIYNSYKEEDE